MSALLTTAEAATYLGLRAHSLRTYRTAGVGPRYQKDGHRVRYRQEDLDAYVAQLQTPSLLAGDVFRSALDAAPTLVRRFAGGSRAEAPGRLVRVFYGDLPCVEISDRRDRVSAQRETFPAAVDAALGMWQGRERKAGGEGAP